jgi:6-phosphofructokinase 1
MKTGFKALIAHGGGPTAVLNASLAGVVDECRGRASALYGARHGLTGRWQDLLTISPDKIAAIAATPGSAIGSSRARLPSDDVDRLAQVLRREDIQVIFYAGGNGSTQTRSSYPATAR